ncbi:EutP/PduV family microcompartment system protein [Lentilactobacillus kosonis]|uniref:Propanediol utilization protein PduV n=1 Tax=Lentilactobacillus kosonis TaxID=2810561 RepID=A0A401FMK5_9LACO|nr:EutP/PduV family microcompartment system protein [Lentilactobacillus kosonis]GAY73604.1 propanediol utilization protein PduV [Lentilactobacillus kosonis]
MKKAMLIGAIGCGKTTLIQALHHIQINYNKTQALDFYDDIIDTPGEYVEHRRLYSTLITTSAEASIIFLLQSSIDKRAIFPPGFTTMFSADVVGIITKVDEASESDIEYARSRLLETGINHIIEVSSVTNQNVDQVRKLIDSHNG